MLQFGNYLFKPIVGRLNQQSAATYPSNHKKIWRERDYKSMYYSTNAKTNNFQAAVKRSTNKLWVKS